MEWIGRLCILVIGVSAVIMDIQKSRIPNEMIAVGLGLGMAYQVITRGAIGALDFMGGAGLPLVLLGVLFYFRMLGAGDIKLLSAIGGFTGVRVILYCIFISLLAGAGISVLIMIKRGNLWKRLSYFSAYVSDYTKDKKWRPYRRLQDRDSQFHFSVAILISVLLYIGGFY